MSRVFNQETAEKLLNTTEDCDLTSYPACVMLWAKVNGYVTNAELFRIVSDSSPDYLSGFVDTSGNVSARQDHSGYRTSGNIAGAGAAWEPYIFQFDTNLTKVQDSTNNSSIATANTWGGATSPRIYIGSSGWDVDKFDGRISHFLVLDELPSAAEIAAFVGGENPATIAVAKQTRYWAFTTSSLTDSLTSSVLTNTLTVFDAEDNPPVKTAYLPTEGIDCIHEIVYQNSTTDRGTGALKIGLFTDTDLDASSAWTDVTQPTSQGGYAEKDLTNASWTISSGTASYAKQSFTASGAAFSSDIQGYYIRTTGTTPRILFFEDIPAQTVADGYQYSVTPSIDMSDGTPAITVDEGIELMLNMVFKGSDTNRGTNLGLALYTNTGTLTTSTSLATMTEPTTGSYADKTLTDASWTITTGVAEYAKQIWTASGAAYAAVYGYYIYSTGTVDKLLHIDEYGSGPSTVADTESYSVDINIDLTDT